MRTVKAVQTITSFTFCDRPWREDSATVKAHKKRAEAARKVKEAELRKRRDLLPPKDGSKGTVWRDMWLPMSREEKLSLCGAESKVDMRKYTYCHKLYPKPMHRNWCGHSEMRWNGYGWEEE
jgi:hypothetical protein